MVAQVLGAAAQLTELLRTPHLGVSIVVEGPAGIGKTTMVERALAPVSTESVRVVRERASPLGRHEPFAAVPSLVPPASGDPLSSAYAVVDEWCARSPVVLWVDDAHDADPDSIAVLRRLWSATAVLPLIIILGVRPECCRAELAALVQQAGHRLSVDPLRSVEVEAVVQQRMGAVPDPGLLRRLEVAGGNPLLLEILTGLLARDGVIRTIDGRAGTVDTQIDDTGTIDTGPIGIGTATAHSARTVVRAHLSQLSPEAMDVTTSVAALGSPADPLDVAAMMRIPLVALPRVMTQAIELGVLGWRGDAVALGHEIYGELLLAELDRPVRTALHRHAAQVLRERHAPDTRVAAQILRAGEDVEDELLRSVAAAAVPRAPGVAADLLDYVSGHTHSLDPGRLAVERATALFLAGRGRDAEDVVHIQLPRTADPEARRQLRALAHRSMVSRASTDAALAEVENLLATRELPARSGLVVREARAWVLLLAGNPAQAEVAAVEGRSFARIAGLRGESELSVATRACLALLRARPVEALTLLPVGENRPVVDPLSVEPTVAAWPALFTLFAAGPDAARRAGRSARTISATQGADWLSALHDSVSALVDWSSGDWDDAVAACDAGLERARETGNGWTSLAVGVRALIDVHAGRLDLARTAVSDFRERGLPALLGLDYPSLAELAAAEATAVADYRSRPSEVAWRRAYEPVRELATDLWTAATAAGGELWLLLISPSVSRMADPSLRGRIAHDIADLHVSSTHALSVVRQHVCGVARRDHDAVADAARRLAELDLPLEAGSGFEEAGLLAARRGDTASARSELRSAADIYATLGAATDLERLRARAHRVGVRIGVGSPRRQLTSGWDALTATERTVAGLVRAGLTNKAIAERLYLSPRTVQTHVSHILQKTGVRSRVDIAAAFSG